MFWRIPDNFEAQLTEAGGYEQHQNVYDDANSENPPATQVTHSDATCGCADHQQRWAQNVTVLCKAPAQLRELSCDIKITHD